MRKELTIQRASLIAMALGLLMIVQPWSAFLFSAGFPFTLAAIAAYNVAGWMTGDRAGKSREEARQRAKAGR